MLPRKLKKVTILGLGKSVYDWVTLSHQDFPDHGEVWTINAGALCFKHDVVFDMHTEGWIYRLKHRDLVKIIKRREFLKTHDKPVYMPKALPGFPTSVTYPLREVVETTGSVYFSTGMSYMLAMAFCCDVEELMLWGCDFAYDPKLSKVNEPGRECCEYWVGRLVQKGCRVAHSQHTHFMDMHKRSRGIIYGYDEPVTMDVPLDGGKARFVGPDYL